MREKYVDEQYGWWFVFGESKDTCDITSADLHTGDVGLHIPKDQAVTLIKEHNRVQRQLSACAIAFDKADHEAFVEFWYGGKT
jgi:hypothetical protein